MTGETGYRLKLINHHGINDICLGFGHLFNDHVSQQSAQVACMLAVERFHKVLFHQLIDLIHSRLDRIDKSSPANNS